MHAQVVFWTGGGSDTNWSTGGNWAGGVAPGPGSLPVLLNGLGNLEVNLDTSPSIIGMYVDTGTIYGWGEYGFLFDKYQFTASAPVTLTMAGEIFETRNVIVDFDPLITIDLTLPMEWNVGDDTLDPVTVNGVLRNNGNALYKTGYGELVLNGANDLTGEVYLQQGLLTLGNNGALGTATLVANNWGVLQGSGPLTLTNPIDLIDDLSLNSSGGALTLNGPFTVNELYGYTYLDVRGGNPVTIGGPFSLGSELEIFPTRSTTLTISGDASAPGLPMPLYLYGPGTVVLSGDWAANTLSDLDVYEGKLIFGSAGSLPNTPGIIYAYGDNAYYYYSSNGYVGLGASGVTAASFLNLFDKSSEGSIGFDNGLVMTGAIDLTGFGALARLGTATTATLDSGATITPQGLSYNFGGGGGTLAVNANLTGDYDLTLVSPFGQPLTLDLGGTNDFTGGLLVDNSILRFSTPGALPGGQISVGDLSYRAYVGFQYSGIDISNVEASSIFGSQFSALPNGASLVLGFDSPGYTSIAGTIDLTGLPTSGYFSTGTFLGTSTELTFSGNLVMPAFSPLRVAAVKDGHLTIDTNLFGSEGLVVNLPGDDYFADPWDFFDMYESFYSDDYRRPFDDGVLDFSDARSTVTLNGENSDLGGPVYLQGGRLEVGSNTALGSGSLQISGDSMLAASVDGITLSVPINSTADAFGIDTSLHDLTLNGTLDGWGLVKDGAGTLTLQGDTNLNYFLQAIDGVINLNGSQFYTDELYLHDGATMNFTTPEPTIYSVVSAAGSSLNLAAGTNLNVWESGFLGGTVSGDGSLHLDGFLLVLNSSNSYTGGTHVDYGELIVRTNGGLGTGAVTVDGGGSLRVERGVTLTNPLTFTGGILGGSGTYSPVGTETITFGGESGVSPGSNPNYGYYYEFKPGALSFDTSLEFGAGGGYFWKLLRTDLVPGVGWDVVKTNGSLDITSTALVPFYFYLTPATYNYYYGDVFFFDPSQSQSWLVASAAGGITGFDPAKFMIDDSYFADLLGGYPLAEFGLSQVGNDLFLNFTPVPEPSTYTLFGVGGLLLWLRWRRRRG